MKVLNGKEVANKIKDQLKEEVSKMQKDICLTVIQVGDNKASNVYVRNKKNACEYIGIESEVYKLSEDVNEEDVIKAINVLNNDNAVNGILVQLPLPKHIDENKVIQTISPEKDVDGFHELNVGKLVIGEDTFIPCTAKGIIELLQYYDIDIEGKECVIVGRSNIVGKPTAIELLHHNGTITMCHSKTRNLKEICKRADILVCAIGKPKFFDKEYVKEGAVVVDVGIHRTENGLCGDVNFDDVKDIVSAITPVPNGIGSMTVAMLMKNCVQAAQMQYNR